MPNQFANLQEHTLGGPWQGHRANLKDVKLKCTQKSFLCDLVVKKHFQAAQVAEFFFLNIHTVRGWLRTFRKGRKWLSSRDGRPRRLYSLSVSRIYELLENNTAWNRSNLYTIIREECLLSWHRMYQMTPGVDITDILKKKMKISKRSLTRYADGFLEKSVIQGLDPE